MSSGLLALASWLLLASSQTTIAFELRRDPDAQRCPDHATLAAQLEARLAQTGAARLPVAEQVSVTIKRTREGYLATVAAMGLAGGTRSLLDPTDDCAGLAEALVLTLSMIADGQPVPPAKEAPSAPAPPAPAPPAPAPPVDRPLEIGAGAFSSTGILGAASVGPTLEVLWHPWPQIAAGLSGLWLPSRSFDNGPGTTSFSLVAGMARLCGGPLAYGGPVFPALCAELGAGGLRGQGQGYVDARSVWVPWLTAGGSVGFGFLVHRSVSLFGRVGYLFSLRNERFKVGGLAPVHDTGHPGFDAGAGVLIRIP
jgi:hypothetical protein